MPLSGRTQECVRRLKEGDRGAFDELVQMYKGRAFASAYGMVGNAEDAKDIVQEAFIRVYTGIAGFRGESGFFTWFYRILINLCRDHLRKKVRTQKIFLDPVEDPQEEASSTPEVSDDSQNPGRAVLEKESRMLLEQAVRRLPQNQRAAFVMRYFDGLKTAEIAAAIGCRPATVKVHLFRACQAVAQRLAPYLRK